MSSLHEVVASIRPGDTIRSTWVGDPLPHEYVVEGVVHKSFGFPLRVGWNCLTEQNGTVMGGLKSVEILERGPCPFYANGSDSRRPRLGDVARFHGPDDLRPDGNYVYTGEYWHVAHAVGLSRGHTFEPGELTLIPATMLEPVDVAVECADCETNGRNCREHR